MVGLKDAKGDSEKISEAKHLTIIPAKSGMNPKTLQYYTHLGLEDAAAAHPEVSINTIVLNEKNIKRVLEILTYREVQKTAKDTIEYIIDEIKPGMSLKEIRFLCEETTVSVSRRDYISSDRNIAMDDIVTIDLSPKVGDTWGDYVRTIIIQNGKVVRSDAEIVNPEWRRGVEMEKRLHNRMMETVRPEMTFEELYYQMNEFIQTEGYINLDFMGNLGHSIVRKKEDRIYIEKGNRTNECGIKELYITA